MSAYARLGDRKASWFRWSTSVLHRLFYLAMGAWHALELFVPPPRDKPDLWTVANVGLGAAGFALCYLWCLGMLVAESGVLRRKPWEDAKTKLKTK